MILCESGEGANQIHPLPVHNDGDDLGSSLMVAAFRVNACSMLYDLHVLAGLTEGAGRAMTSSGCLAGFSG